MVFVNTIFSLILILQFVEWIVDYFLSFRPTFLLLEIPKLFIHFLILFFLNKGIDECHEWCKLVFIDAYFDILKTVDYNPITAFIHALILWVSKRLGVVKCICTLLLEFLKHIFNLYTHVNGFVDDVFNCRPYRPCDAITLCLIFFFQIFIENLNPLDNTVNIQILQHYYQS